MSDLFAQTLAGAAIIIALIGTFATLAVSLNIKQEREARVKQVDVFLKGQCMRDALRDKIIAGALKDAQDRARSSISDPRIQRLSVGKLQMTIDDLGKLQGKCVRALPEK